MATSKKKKVIKKAASSKSKKPSKVSKPAKAAKAKSPAKKAASSKPAPKAKVKPSFAKATAKTAAPKSSKEWTQLFTPLDDRVVVDCGPAEQKTAGGLYIPQVAIEKPTGGVVVLVGRGRRDKKGKVHPLDVQPGDHVLFSNYSAMPIELNGTRVLIVRESEIMGVQN